MSSPNEKLMIDTCGTLKNYWYVGALSKDIKGGKPYKSVIMDLPLVIWRNSKGEIAAMIDRCNHRNAPLSNGKIKNDCLVCPYHGWVYNISGQCEHIPSEGPNHDRIPNKKLEVFPVQEKYGLCWIWMGRDIPANSMPFEMPHFNTDGWHNYYMTTDFDNEVTDLVENFMDIPHTVSVHKGWFRDLKQICIKAEVERTADSVLVSYDQPDDSIGFFNMLINPKRLPLKHTDNFYMPNVTRVDYVYGENEKAFIITSTCTPISKLKTKVYTLITYKLGWFNIFAGFFLPWYTRKVINQDVWIMNIHGKNMNIFASPDYKSTQADTMHIYIESLRRAAESNEGSIKPQPIKKQIEFWV